jgi:stress-induced-phosphoprotein 1
LKAPCDPTFESDILDSSLCFQTGQPVPLYPTAAAEHQKSPMIMAKIQKLINAGIVQTRG